MLQKLQINPRYTAAHQKTWGWRKKKWQKPEHIAHLQFDEKRSKAGKTVQNHCGWSENFNLSFFLKQKLFSKNKCSIVGVVNSQTGHSFDFVLFFLILSFRFSHQIGFFTVILTPHLNTIFQMKSNCVPGRVARKTSIDNVESVLRKLFYWFTLDVVWDDLQQRKKIQRNRFKNISEIFLFNPSFFHVFEEGLKTPLMFNLSYKMFFELWVMLCECWKRPEDLFSSKKMFKCL